MPHPKSASECVVASEQLIAAKTGKRNSRASIPDSPRDDECVNAVNRGLIQSAHSIGQHTNQCIFREQNLTVICLEFFRDETRVPAFRKLPFLEDHAEGLWPIFCYAAHQCHERARIHPAR